MSEKRFTFIKNSSVTQYALLPIRDVDGKTYHCQGVIDKLNALYEENIILKNKIRLINKPITQVMLLLLDDEFKSNLTEIELKSFEELSKFGDDSVFTRCKEYGVGCLKCPYWNNWSNYCTKFKIWSDYE